MIRWGHTSGKCFLISFAVCSPTIARWPSRDRVTRFAISPLMNWSRKGAATCPRRSSSLVRNFRTAGTRSSGFSTALFGNGKDVDLDISVRDISYWSKHKLSLKIEIANFEIAATDVRLLKAQTELIFLHLNSLTHNEASLSANQNAAFNLSWELTIFSVSGRS